ncbi:uncharacterized protein LOC121957581 [Plectropomus leopardus]|uniref:uncharacterized protein LOC121957581 n=1 Tax=Plectropomus leopardus TaxID=160734 RepID=UPI001C4B9161|nr:uncharacterized protein LOC121957581 [Plectropomus leopardus]
MKLRLSGYFLVAGLFLIASALTPEECQSVLTPLSLDDRSTMYGRWNFIVGYTDHDVFNSILKITESSWMNISTSSSPNEDVVTQEEKMNGTCVATSVTVAVDGKAASTTFANLTSEFHVLPSCDGCLVMSINCTTKNLDKFLQALKIDSNPTGDEISVRALYLWSRESTLKDSDLEHFKQQASCLGFSRDPDFLYDTKNDFCAEGEGVKVSLK